MRPIILLRTDCDEAQTRRIRYTIAHVRSLFRSMYILRFGWPMQTQSTTPQLHNSYLALANVETAESNNGFHLSKSTSFGVNASARVWVCAECRRLCLFTTLSLSVCCSPTHTCSPCLPLPPSLLNTNFGFCTGAVLCTDCTHGYNVPNSVRSSRCVNQCSAESTGRIMSHTFLS